MREMEREGKKKTKRGRDTHDVDSGTWIHFFRTLKTYIDHNLGVMTTASSLAYGFLPLNPSPGIWKVQREM